MKRKAFTLTELLVVVVIIGVLSAVVLPKFTKVIETRKTTEAEEMMTAVRTEQEARCSLSKNYTDIEKLGSYRAGKNFSYANNSEGVGIVATAKNNKYNLEIPSYADGRVCCSDIEAGACANLNKSYPSCSDLINNTSDYVAGNASCGVPGVEENLEPEPDEPVAKCTEGEVTGSQVCNWCGTQTTQICKGGEWVDQLGECSKKEEECKEYCEYGKPGWDKWSDTAQKCEQPQAPDALEGTWNTTTCKCDCPENTELSPDGEGCIYACPKTTANLGKAQDCEDPQVVPGYAPVPGVWNWNGPHACDCDCPPGTKLDEDGHCVGECQKTDENLWKAQDCKTGGQPSQIAVDGVGRAIYNTVEGTWNWSSCECDCPSTIKNNWAPSGVTYTSVERNGLCYLKCESGHANEQSISECVNGTYADRKAGIAEPGYWNQGTCQCQCATRYGVQRRTAGGETTSCYRDNCTTANPPFNWDVMKERCELTSQNNLSACCDGYINKNGATTNCTRVKNNGCVSDSVTPIYVKGKWNADKCQCNCPKGNVKLGNDGYCKQIGENVSTQHYYDEWRDSDGPDEHNDREEWPENDPNDPELDDDYMGSGVNGSGWDDEGSDPSFFFVGGAYDEATGWFGVDVVVHHGDDDGNGYLGDEGWGYYDD